MEISRTLLKPYSLYRYLNIFHKHLFLHQLTHNITKDSINNLSTYCDLVDAEISASDKDLPVQLQFEHHRGPESIKEQITLQSGI